MSRCCFKSNVEVRETSSFGHLRDISAPLEAYLSKVTHHLSRCLRKTPASAFTPILHSHISFHVHWGYLSIFFPAADTARWKLHAISLCMRTAGRAPFSVCHKFVCIFHSSQRYFHESVVRSMLTRPGLTRPQMAACLCLQRGRNGRPGLVQPEVMQGPVTGV